MPELIFIHIPKCGGISFLHSLNEIYGQENVKQIWELLPWPDDELLITWDSPFFMDQGEFRNIVCDCLQDVDYPVLFGHMPVWVLEDLFPDVPRITWIRNPLEQVLSRVFHFRKMKIGNYHHWNSPWAISKEPIFRNNQFFHTGGHVSQFDFVGVLDTHEQDMRRACDLFNWPQVTPHHLHKTEFEEDKRQALRSNPYFVKDIKIMNAWDYSLYSWVVHHGT